MESFDFDIPNIIVLWISLQSVTIQRGIFRRVSWENVGSTQELSLKKNNYKHISCDGLQRKDT